MLEVVRELIDAVAAMRGISGNRQAELHAQLDELSPGPRAAPPAVKPKPAKAEPDVPAGT